MTDPAFFGDEPQGAVRYLRAVRAHWLLVLLIVAAAVAAAAAYSFTATKRYQAETDVLVSPVGSSDFPGFRFLRDIGDGTRTVLTAARFVTTPEVADTAAASLDIGVSGQKLLEQVSVQPVSQSNIVAIEATAPSAQLAADIANSFGNALVSERTKQFQADLESAISRLRKQVDALPPGGIDNGRARAPAAARELRVTRRRKRPDPPDRQRGGPPGRGLGPRPVLSIVISFVAALLLGIGLAIALELVGPRIANEDELLLRQRLPILARVPRLTSRTVRGYLTKHDPMPPGAWEAYRTLRAALAVAGPDGGYPPTILVTSAIPGEGKTMTSTNLAITMAVAGHRVILVDGDLRRPMIATVFGVAARRHGFASLLLGEASAEEVLVPAPGYAGQLQILVAGPEQAHLVDLLEPVRVERALAQLKQLADVVILDSPPLTEVADALALADAAAAVIVTVRLGYSRRDRLAELRRMLAQQGIVPTGLVVTTRERPSRDGYHYHSPETTEVFRGENGDEPAALRDATRQAQS